MYRQYSWFPHHFVFTDSDIAPWGDLSGPVCTQADWIVPMKGKVHKPLLERQLCGKNLVSITSCLSLVYTFFAFYM